MSKIRQLSNYNWAERSINVLGGFWKCEAVQRSPVGDSHLSFDARIQGYCEIARTSLHGVFQLRSRTVVVSELALGHVVIWTCCERKDWEISQGSDTSGARVVHMREAYNFASIR